MPYKWLKYVSGILIVQMSHISVGPKALFGWHYILSVRDDNRLFPSVIWKHAVNVMRYLWLWFLREKLLMWGRLIAPPVSANVILPSEAMLGSTVLFHIKSISRRQRKSFTFQQWKTAVQWWLCPGSRRECHEFL